MNSGSITPSKREPSKSDTVNDSIGSTCTLPTLNSNVSNVAKSTGGSVPAQGLPLNANGMRNTCAGEKGSAAQVATSPQLVTNDQ